MMKHLRDTGSVGSRTVIWVLGGALACAVLAVVYAFRAPVVLTHDRRGSTQRGMDRLATSIRLASFAPPLGLPRSVLSLGQQDLWKALKERVHSCREYEREPFTDLWGRPFGLRVREVPGLPDGEKPLPDGWALAELTVWSYGPDGTDDRGTGDDVTRTDKTEATFILVRPAEPTSSTSTHTPATDPQ